jgi:hypothetical protein
MLLKDTGLRFCSLSSKAAKFTEYKLTGDKACLRKSPTRRKQNREKGEINP